MDVVVGKDGRISSSSILEAPSASAGESVRQALSDWTFEPFRPNGEPLEVRSKLTFYVRLEGKRSVVVSASAKLPAPARVSRVAVITEDGLTTLAAAGPLVVVDIRGRPEFQSGHRPGAINIPGDEILSRAADELGFGKPAVIDCSGGRIDYCHNVAQRLQNIGVERVFVLNTKRP